MYKTSGNNAFKHISNDVVKTNIIDVQYGVCGKTQKKRSASCKIHESPKMIKVDAKINLERERHERSVELKFSKQRIKTVIMVFFTISLIAVMLMGILIRNSKIIEMNYKNIRLEREIKLINTENETIKEEIVNTINLSELRVRAINELGMQVPAQSQIITVSIPGADRVVLDASGNSNSGETADLDNLFDNIEGFFKTMR